MQATDILARLTAPVIWFSDFENALQLSIALSQASRK